MDDELAALARNRTYVLVPPSSHNIVDGKSFRSSGCG